MESAPPWSRDVHSTNMAAERCCCTTCHAVRLHGPCAAMAGLSRCAALASTVVTPTRRQALYSASALYSSMAFWYRTLSACVQNHASKKQVSASDNGHAAASPHANTCTDNDAAPLRQQQAHLCLLVVLLLALVVQLLPQSTQLGGDLSGLQADVQAYTVSRGQDFCKSGLVAECTTVAVLR